jgi:hypothetical protein
MLFKGIEQIIECYCHAPSQSTGPEECVTGVPQAVETRKKLMFNALLHNWCHAAVQHGDTAPVAGERYINTVIGQRQAGNHCPWAVGQHQ